MVTALDVWHMKQKNLHNTSVARLFGRLLKCGLLIMFLICFGHFLETVNTAISPKMFVYPVFQSPDALPGAFPVVLYHHELSLRLDERTVWLQCAEDLDQWKAIGHVSDVTADAAASE